MSVFTDARDSILNQNFSKDQREIGQKIIDGIKKGVPQSPIAKPPEAAQVITDVKVAPNKVIMIAIGVAALVAIAFLIKK